MKRSGQWIRVFCTIGAVLAGSASLSAQNYVRDSEPALFSYSELVQLSLAQEMSPELAQKVHVVTTTPFINNEAYYNGAKPRPLELKELGPSLRVACWNIERGMELDDIQLFLTDKDRFMAKVQADRKKAVETGQRVRAVDIEKISDQIETLKAADVWVLNELDWGVKRSQYREVVRELARTLNMNWAYGVEFLEIDSKQLGTDTFAEVEDPKARADLLEQFRVDKDRVRALHGTAVLSRYPIREARLKPFTVGYDWFKENKIKPLEKAKRKAAVLVGEDLVRESRRGGRMTLFVELDVPELAGQRLTIAATHLENRTKPKVRRQQMQELLNAVSDTHNPVIVAGDLNTTGSDSTPTSVTNMLYKRFGSVDFWTTKGIQWTTGVGLVYSGTKTLVKLAGIQTRIDPTSKNVPGLRANLEKGLFDTVEKFRFSDGKAFDFRGAPDQTINGTSGTLANSNQRLSKGFTPTFVTELVWGKLRVAKFRLDWIFVKSDLDSPHGPQGSNIFAPHFARTLSDLNNFTPEPISDHSPITVDLPFHAPNELGAKAN